MRGRKGDGLDGWGSGVREIRRGRPGWMWEWVEGEKKGQGLMNGGMEGAGLNGCGRGLRERGRGKTGWMGE